MPNHPVWIVGARDLTISTPIPTDPSRHGLTSATLTVQTPFWRAAYLSTDADTMLCNGDAPRTLHTTDGDQLHPEWMLNASDGSRDHTLLAVTDRHGETHLAAIGPQPPETPSLSIRTAKRTASPETPHTPATPPGFTAGTLIRTLDGDIPVEWLQIGDRVITRDHGAQPLRWAGHVHYARRNLVRQGHLRPIRIRAHALGRNTPDRDILVSPDHRLVIRTAAAQNLFGHREVLAHARHLVDGAAISLPRNVPDVTYVHLLFDRHEVVYADGLEAESYLPATPILDIFDDIAQSALRTLMPDLERTAKPAATARPTLSAWEARLLVGQSAQAPEQHTKVA